MRNGEGGIRTHE